MKKIKDIDSPRKIRGAWSAGFDAGYKLGLEMRRKEGWRRISNIEELQIGDLVKLFVPTISGWTGIAEVHDTFGGSLKLKKLDKNYEDRFGLVDCCIDEVLKKTITHEVIK